MGGIDDEIAGHAVAEQSAVEHGIADPAAAKHAAAARAIVDQLRRVVLGQDAAIRDSVAALLARGHVLLLANHAPAAPAAAPVPATRATVRAALAAIGDAMDPAEDILLLYATTHGSQDHWLLLRRDGWPDATLDGHRPRVFAPFSAATRDPSEKAA